MKIVGVNVTTLGKLMIITIGKHSFHTLVAKTDDQHERGLMFRKNPPVMCFPYKSADWRRFWMKNTPSSLDIIFCRSGKIVSIHKGEPFSTEMVGPNEPTDFVVELPYGTANKFGFIIGEKISLKKGLSYARLDVAADRFMKRIG